MEEVCVKKRDGRFEPINEDKINQVLEWACEGLDGVYPSEIAMKAKIQFTDGVSTQSIHKTLTKTAADMIEPYQPNYQYVAARLALFDLRKRVYGGYEPDDLLYHIEELVHLGRYDEEILEKYTKEEINELGEYIDHDRDFKFAYSGMKQMEAKYLVQDRVTGQVFETPQMLYMLVGMCLYQETNKEERLDKVRKFYDATSLFKLSLPTPILGGVRTPTRQFSSCTLIESGDDLDEINATSDAIVKYASKRAGIGINGGAIRAVGSSIRGGEAVHTGCLGFYKYFKAALKSCSQGALRGASATLFYPMWHYEVENLLVLKNNKGTEENRLREIDYGVQLNAYLWKRLLEDKKITLFSPDVADGELYQTFFSDQKRFAELYEELEDNHAVRKKRIKAKDLFKIFATERAETGRIYTMFVDNVNENGVFNPRVAPVRQSNLCLEIVLPTEPMKDIQSGDGEVALCTLAAFNLGEITCLEDLEELSEVAVEALDNLLDYQDYPLLAAHKSSMGRRTLGIGVTNFAYYLAKNGCKYSDGTGNKLTHELAEAMQYYLLKASVELAKEKGCCDWFEQTKYAQGILPIDYKENICDKVFTTDLLLDWESLREDIEHYGLRNSTLTAIMPAESSSLVSNSTNGIEPVRDLVVTKGSKDGVFKQLVPEVVDLYTEYETCWEMKDNKGYLTLVSIFQKFFDQAISANTYEDPAKYPEGKVPLTKILNEMYYAYQLGVKTLYYHNTRDGAGEEDSGCESGACSI